MQFSAYTDHQSIIHLLKQPLLSPRQTRVVEFLADYHVEIEYRPGSGNITADALSRRSDLKPRTVASLSLEQFHELLPNIVGQYHTDDTLSKVYLVFKEFPVKAATLYPHYVLSMGILYYKFRLCIPDITGLCTKLVTETHDSLIAGHPGIDKTLNTLKQNFFWPKMRTFVDNYVNSCDSCQRYKNSQVKPAGLLKPMPIPDRCWDSCSMDFLTSLPPTQRGHTSVMIVVDPLSKMAHFIPCRDTSNAEVVAGIFVDSVVRLHGVPRNFISDRDPKFVSVFWKTVWSLLGTTLLMSTARHPQTDDQTEQTIKTLQQYLRAHIKYN